MVNKIEKRIVAILRVHIGKIMIKREREKGESMCVKEREREREREREKGERMFKRERVSILWVDLCILK